MKKSIKWIIAAAVSVLLFAGVYGLYVFLSNTYALDPFAGNAQSQTNAVDKPSGASSQTEQEDASSRVEAPDFTVVDAQEEEVKLSDYFGKPIVLNFWASWCGYCIQEMPDFQEAYLNNPDIQFLMVNATDGYQETLESAKSFIEEAGYTFPVLYDTKMEAVSAYGAFGLPMTIFIDKEGKVVAYANGMLSAENLEKGMQMIQ